MEGIRSSIYAIAVISVSVGIIDVFSGIGNLKKYTRYIVSLVVVVCLLAPVTDVFFNENDAFFKDYSGIITDDFSKNENAYKTSVSLSISQKISEYFSLPKNSFETEIEIESREKETIITDIKITITNQKYFYLCEKIEVYLKSTFGCNVQVIQGFGE